MKVRNNKSNWLTIFLICFSFFSLACSREKSDTDTVRLNVYSPVNCYYEFQITKDSLYLKSIDVSSRLKNAPKSDTTIVTQCVSFNTETKNAAIYFFNVIKDRQFKIEGLRQTDAYQYEMFLNDALVARELCCDEEINRFLRKCLPYIDKELTCSGFFDMVAETKD